jgi:hypothetical protein
VVHGMGSARASFTESNEEYARFLSGSNAIHRSRKPLALLPGAKAPKSVTLVLQINRPRGVPAPIIVFWRRSCGVRLGFRQVMPLSAKPDVFRADPKAVPTMPGTSRLHTLLRMTRDRQESSRWQRIQDKGQTQNAERKVACRNLAKAVCESRICSKHNLPCHYNGLTFEVPDLVTNFKPAADCQLQIASPDNERTPHQPLRFIATVLRLTTR